MAKRPREGRQKTFPFRKMCQDGHKRLQEASQDTLGSAPRRQNHWFYNGKTYIFHFVFPPAFDVPDVPQEPPRPPQNGRERGTGGPRRRQDGPKRRPRGRKKNSNRFKRATRSPKSRPRAPQETAKNRPGGNREPPDGGLGARPDPETLSGPFFDHFGSSFG